jgi:hypothetical protein
MDESTIIVASGDQSSMRSEESCVSNRVNIANMGERLFSTLAMASSSTPTKTPGLWLPTKQRVCRSHYKHDEGIRLRCASKCQLASEDLDALVFAKSDEDLRNMLEEYDMVGDREDLFKARSQQILVEDWRGRLRQHREGRAGDGRTGGRGGRGGRGASQGLALLCVFVVGVLNGAYPSRF